MLSGYDPAGPEADELINRSMKNSPTFGLNLDAGFNATPVDIHHNFEIAEKSPNTPEAEKAVANYYYAQIGREMVEPMQFDAGVPGSGKSKANDSWIVPAAIGAAVLVLGLGVLSAKG